MRNVVTTASMLLCACSMAITDEPDHDVVDSLEQNLSSEELGFQEQSTLPIQAETENKIRARVIQLDDTSFPDRRLPALDCAANFCPAGESAPPPPPSTPMDSAFDRPCPTCNVCATCALNQATKRISIKVDADLFGAYVTQVGAPRLVVNGSKIWSSASQLVAGPLYIGTVGSLPATVWSAKLKFDVVTADGLQQTVENVLYSP